MRLFNTNPVNFIVVSMSSRLLLYTVTILKVWKQSGSLAALTHMNDFKWFDLSYDVIKLAQCFHAADNHCATAAAQLWYDVGTLTQHGLVSPGLPFRCSTSYLRKCLTLKILTLFAECIMGGFFKAALLLWKRSGFVSEKIRWERFYLSLWGKKFKYKTFVN